MVELKAKSRTELGKKAGALRRAGFLPAVIYGEGVPSQSIAVAYKDFEKAYKKAGESTIVKLDVDGKAYNVLIHDITYDPLKGTSLHADFYAVRMDKEIRTKVPVEFIGESSAVKNDGGILVKVVQEIEVEAFPQDLPHELKADLSLLDTLQSRILVKDIALPKGVKIHIDPEEVVALVESPRTDEELASELEVKPDEGVAEVLTEQDAKRAEKVAKGEAVGEKTEKSAVAPASAKATADKKAKADK
jgi:large subunit ribosomal protein L25